MEKTVKFTAMSEVVQQFRSKDWEIVESQDKVVELTKDNITITLDAAKSPIYNEYVLTHVWIKDGEDDWRPPTAAEMAEILNSLI